MKFTKEFDLYTFEFWSGARDTIERVQLLDMMHELESLIEESFYGRTPTETEINDFVWYETDFIEDYIGVDLFED